MKRLRSYDLSRAPGDKATICQAALATSAATGFFSVVNIEARKYIDGALGSNNPVEEVESEASKIWKKPNIQHVVKCFVSIGTGHPGNRGLREKMTDFLSKTLVEMVTDTERTATKFVERWQVHHEAGRYFRFNVQHGLQNVGLAEYKERGLMQAATEEYLAHQEQQSRKELCILNLMQKQSLYTERSG